MRKRIHTLSAKPGQLRAGWGRPEPGQAADLVYAWGGDGAAKSGGIALSHALEGMKNEDGRSLREELEHRGYNISTLKVSIEQKPKPTEKDRQEPA